MGIGAVVVVTAVGAGFWYWSERTPVRPTDRSLSEEDIAALEELASDRLSPFGSSFWQYIDDVGISLEPEPAPEWLSESSEERRRGSRYGWGTTMVDDVLIVLVDGELAAVRLGEEPEVVGRLTLPVRDGHEFRDDLLDVGGQAVVSSVRQRGGEVSLLRIGPQGELAAESFRVSGPCVQRAAGDRLIVSCRVALPNDPNALPVIASDDAARGTRLLDWGEIYRPILPISDPLVEVIGVCDVASGELRCNGHGFVVGTDTRSVDLDGATYVHARADSRVVDERSKLRHGDFGCLDFERLVDRHQVRRGLEAEALLVAVLMRQFETTFVSV